ncbi:MAG: arginine--tRNA ligase [Deltaproteobacteria bacterium]|nr:arginine--tRNA ligase [Deltaproteobacteria bacterium]
MILKIKSQMAEILDVDVSEIQSPVSKQNYGDLAFPLFSTAKNRKQNIEAVFTDFSAKLRFLECVQDIKLIGGFLNIYLDWNRIFLTAVSNGIRNLFTFSDFSRVLIEYSQPNTHKPFHVGHLRNACLGSALVNLAKFVGNSVISINYPGDVGTHVARCLWFLDKFKPSVPETRRVDFLGECYFRAVQLLELENLSHFPYLNCAFGVVTRKVSDNVYQVSINNECILAGWDGSELREGIWIVVAHRNSKAWGLSNPQLRKFDWIVLSKRIIEQKPEDEAIWFENKPDDDDPIEFFRKDKSQSNILTCWRKANEEVSVILQALEKKLEPWYPMWIETRSWCLDELQNIYDWLGCHFNQYFFESELTELAQQIVDDFLEKGVFCERDGAIGIDLEELGFFVLRKSDNTVLYSTRDLALAYEKSRMFEFDKSFYVVDQAQSRHFEQVFATLERMGFRDSAKLIHLSYALVITQEGKISSRSKNYYTFWQLKDLAVNTILRDYYAHCSDGAETRTLAEKIAKACIRYGMLKTDNHSPVVFNLNEWLSVNGNSGAYLLYTYARFKTILNKANLKSTWEKEWELDADELDILKKCVFLEESIKKAYESMSPHVICDYAFKLCQALNKFYNNVPILKAEAEKRDIRLCLCRIACEVLECCFEIIGIDRLEKV